MRRKIQQGFSLVSAIFLLVVIAMLGTFAVTLSTTQHQSAAMDVMGSRAYQASRAGIEWAAFGVSQTNPGELWGGCTAGTSFSPTTTPLGGTLAPFSVSVTCSATSHPEGTDSLGATKYIWIYDVSAVANAGTLGGPDYIERVIRVKMGR